jgi:hypothetical protein
MGMPGMRESRAQVLTGHIVGHIVILPAVEA